MTTGITTSVETLEGNKVKLHVAVPTARFDRAIDAAFRKLAKEVRIDGFRPGKAPRRLLEARFGTDAAREQALRDSLPDFYAEAVREENIDVIAAPEIDITAGEESGDVEFDAVVEVRPTTTVSGYEGLRVELPDPTPTDEQLDAQVDALRRRFATLDESGAPLSEGHFATIDLSGSVDGELVDDLAVTDFLYEVGSGGVVPELDRAMAGKRPGDIVTFDASLPERFGPRAGSEVAFKVLVKEAKQPKLPELTDEWVAEVSELETVDDLRADIRKRLDLVGRVQAQMALRDRVLEAAAGLVQLDVPETLIDQEAERRLHDLHHQLEPRGLSIPQYLAATGRDQQEFLAELKTSAAQSVRADLALRAVVVQEAIEATEAELEAEVERLAERLSEKPSRVRKDLDRRGVLEAVRSDIARGKALQFLVDHATVVDEEGNALELEIPDTGEAGATETHDGESPEEETT